MAHNPENYPDLPATDNSTTLRELFAPVLNVKTVERATALFKQYTAWFMDVAPDADPKTIRTVISQGIADHATGYGVYAEISHLFGMGKFEQDPYAAGRRPRTNGGTTAHSFAKDTLG